jgi:hypothetical protein
MGRGSALGASRERKTDEHARVKTRRPRPLRLRWLPKFPYLRHACLPFLITAPLEGLATASGWCPARRRIIVDLTFEEGDPVVGDGDKFPPDLTGGVQEI